MNRKRSQLQSYLAGVFDGEGHVGIHKQEKGSYQLKVCMQMDDPQAVMLMWREYPEAILSHHHEKKFWKVALNQHKAARFLEEIIPFLIVKKEQAKVARSFLSHRAQEHTGKRSGGTQCGRCQYLFAALLKARSDNKRVNSVNAFLDYELREYRAKREEVEQDVQQINARMKVLLEGVETRHRDSTPVEAISALEKDIVQSETN
jgi:hypothetical protein